MTTTTNVPEACRGCPWRTSNQGTRHPDGWYTKANLRRLWTAIRRTGTLNSCHPTDPGNTVSEKAQAAGIRPAPEHSKVRECTGAVILVSRELMYLDRAATLAEYRREHPRGLTPEAAFPLAMRATTASNPITGETLPRPNLNDSDIGYEVLGPWVPPTAREATTS